MSKKDDALKLALEALGAFEKDKRVDYRAWDESKASEAITAIREALAESALERMEKNERELGLDYMVPVDFTSLLSEAEEIIRAKPVWKRFIDGTPLSNDIAVWMAVFAQDVARRTSPQPSKQWAGLTPEDKAEIEKIVGITEDDDGWMVSQMFTLTETKLREKNT